MNLPIIHRVIFTIILSGIMSASMTVIISSFYIEIKFNNFINIWFKAWYSAFNIILIISPILHKFSKHILEIYRKIMI